MKENTNIRFNPDYAHKAGLTLINTIIVLLKRYSKKVEYEYFQKTHVGTHQICIAKCEF